MSKLRSTFCTLLVPLVLAAVACSAAAQSASASLGWSQGPDTPQISVAFDKQLFSKNALDMKAVTFGSGREAFEALLGGQVDFIVVAELPVVTGAMRKQPFVVIADLSRFKGNRLIGTGNLTSVKDLNGRKVGTTIGTAMQFVLESAMAKAGVKAEIVNAAPSDLVPALARGDIDAALPFAGFVPMGRRVLGDRYKEVALPNETHLLLAASRDVVEKRPEVVRKALAAILEADKLVQADPAAARDTIARMSSGAVKADVLAASWGEYDFRTRLDKSLVDLLVEEAAWVSSTGMIKNVAATAGLFQPYVDFAPLKALDASRVTGP